MEYTSNSFFKTRVSRLSRSTLFAGVLLCLCLTVIVELLFSLSHGIKSSIGFEEVINYFSMHGFLIDHIKDPSALMHVGISAEDKGIIDARLLRSVVALCAGGAFALSGVALQGALRNPLADAGILGISSGAVCAILFSIVVLGISTPSLYSVGALCGGVLAGGIIILIACKGGMSKNPASLIIAGAALTALISAFNHALVLSGGTRIQGYLRWTVGTTTQSSWSEVSLGLIVLLAGFLILLSQAKNLDMMQMGDDVASSLGVNTHRTRTLACISGIFTCSAGVLLSGPLAFLGLMVPHIIRGFQVRSHVALASFSIFLGGFITLAADIAGRCISQQFEIPTGVSLTVIGFVVLCLLLRNREVER